MVVPRDNTQSPGSPAKSKPRLNLPILRHHIPFRQHHSQLHLLRPLRENQHPMRQIIIAEPVLRMPAAAARIDLFHYLTDLFLIVYDFNFLPLRRNPQLIKIPLDNRSTVNPLN